MTIDIICTQPSHVDFPLWRHLLETKRHLFKDIFVGFSNANRKINVLAFQSQQLTNIGVKIISDTTLIPGHDWRSSAINKCLVQSTADKVLFLEQDFIAFDDDFYDNVVNFSDPLIGFKESVDRSGRLHPAFLLVDRSLLNSTSLQFSADPPKYDHFGIVSEQLESVAKPTYLEDLFPNKWEHLAGLTHNYSLLMEGQTPNHNLSRFIAYNKQCLALPVSQCPSFLPIINSAASL